MCNALQHSSMQWNAVRCHCVVSGQTNISSRHGPDSAQAVLSLMGNLQTASLWHFTFYSTLFATVNYCTNIPSLFAKFDLETGFLKAETAATSGCTKNVWSWVLFYDVQNFRKNLECGKKEIILLVFIFYINIYCYNCMFDVFTCQRKYKFVQYPTAKFTINYWQMAPNYFLSPKCHFFYFRI